MKYSFRFVDDKLNRKLLALLRAAKTNHVVVKDGEVHYSDADEELLENELILSVRNSVFTSWQVLSCPSDWTARYKAYMAKNGVPFAEELIDDQLCFLLPRNYRPHSWKLGKQLTLQKRTLAL